MKQVTKDGIVMTANDPDVIMDVQKLMDDSQGNRLPINDPRLKIQTRDNLTDAEVKAQAEATKKWANQVLKDAK